MSAGDDHRARAHFEQPLPGRFHPVHVLHFHSRQEFGFGDVWRDHARALQQFVAHELQSRCVEQFGIARRRPRNRVEHDVREFVFVEEFGDHRSIRAIPQHADFHGGNRGVFGQRIELRAQRCGGRWMHGAHSLRRLHGQRRHRRHAVTVVRRERFQIRRDACAARGIESRNRQQDRRCVVSVIRVSGVTAQIRVSSALGTNAGDTPIAWVHRQIKMYARWRSARNNIFSCAVSWSIRPSAVWSLEARRRFVHANGFSSPLGP